jgi:DNA-binding response OmpR family regulator
MTTEKRVICVSWNEALAKSRELLLRSLGVTVLSALYEQEARSMCREDADLLILGHSIPRAEKRKIIQCFREHSTAPVLSLLQTGDTKLPEATFGVESAKPEEVLRVVRQILQVRTEN